MDNNTQFFNTYRHSTSTTPNFVFQKGISNNRYNRNNRNLSIENQTQLKRDNDNDIDIETHLENEKKKDISKTLKHEKQKLKQHQHMKKVFSNRPSSYSGCSSCNKK